MVLALITSMLCHASQIWLALQMTNILDSWLLATNTTDSQMKPQSQMSDISFQHYY